MTARLALVVAGICFVLGLAACGERPQVVEYKQGTYQGKVDQTPFATAPWNGNKTEWDTAIRTRMQFQNEYRRTND